MQIEKFEEKQARKPTVKEIALITRETRPAELKEIATGEVLALQRSQLSPEEWQAIAGSSCSGGSAERCRFKLVRNARRFAPVSRICSSGRASCGSTRFWPKLSISRWDHWIWTTLKQIASNGEAGLVRLARSAENRLLSECCTRQGLELEQWAVKYVDATKDTCPALNSGFVPAAHLSEEQKEAVASILGTRDRVFSFRGVAGAGKTTTLREVQRGLNEAGHTVFAITPTASAARVLRNEGFAQATTVEDFLRNAEKRGGLRNAVVICDEAGLKSNRQGAELLRLAQKHDMRVLLVGDVRQHVSVEAGDFLRVLEAHSKLGRCQVEEIHRQIPADYRAAVDANGRGQCPRRSWRTGSPQLDQGRTVELSGKGRCGLICGLRITARNLDRCLAVSFTWEENHRFTDSIRKGLKERGVLPAEGTRLTVHESLRWTNQQKRDWQRYEPGQVVTFAPARQSPAVLRNGRAR